MQPRGDTELAESYTSCAVRFLGFLLSPAGVGCMDKAHAWVITGMHNNIQQCALYEAQRNRFGRFVTSSISHGLEAGDAYM